MHRLRPVRGSLPPACDCDAVKEKKSRKKGPSSRTVLPFCPSFLPFFLALLSCPSFLKERSKELLCRRAGREPPLCLARLYGFVSAIFCGVGNASSAFPCKERSKDQRDAGPMPRDGAQAAPLPCAVLRFCVRVILRCRKRELGFSLKERSKDQRDAGPMPRDGAQAAPLPCAVLRFCVRVILRCRKRELGFSLKERSKDQRDAGPMPRDRARAAPLPCADLQFYVRDFLRCQKRELGFSL